MSTTTTNYGLIKPDTTDPILIGQLNDNADVIDATLKSLSDAIDTAKLGIKYKGEVNYYSDLPITGNEIGDAYTVKYAGSSGTTPDGTEYVWGAVSGVNQWINFSKDSYSKAEVDALLGGKVDKETGKGLSTNDFTTTEKTKLAGIAEGAEVNVQSDWTQTTTTADDYIKNKPTLGTAAAKNATDTYNSTGDDVTTGKAVAAALATLPEPMIFKGSLGTGGTITTLPTASSSNKGYVYKVITAGTYASQSAKVGDTFISDGSAWVLIPSGDEPSGTVTNVAVANGGGLTVSGSPITSSGTITVGHSNSVTAKTSSSLKKFTYDAYGHVTDSSELSTAESDALASGIDSTKVAQIETNKNNILSLDAEVDTVANLGVKNLLDFDKWASNVPVYNGTKSYSNGVMTVTATGSGCVTYHNQYFPEALKIPVKEGEKYTITWDTTVTTNIGFFQLCPNGNAISGTDVSIANKQTEYTVASGVTYLTYRVGVWASGKSINISKLMLRPATISDSTYQPYAMSNAELTAAIQALQAQLANQ